MYYMLLHDIYIVKATLEFNALLKNSNSLVDE